MQVQQNRWICGFYLIIFVMKMNHFISIFLSLWKFVECLRTCFINFASKFGVWGMNLVQNQWIYEISWQLISSRVMKYHVKLLMLLFLLQKSRCLNKYLLSRVKQSKTEHRIEFKSDLFVLHMFSDGNKWMKWPVPN